MWLNFSSVCLYCFNTTHSFLLTKQVAKGCQICTLITCFDLKTIQSLLTCVRWVLAIASAPCIRSDGPAGWHACVKYSPLHYNAYFIPWHPVEIILCVARLHQNRQSMRRPERGNVLLERCAIPNDTVVQSDTRIVATVIERLLIFIVRAIYSCARSETQGPVLAVIRAV